MTGAADPAQAVEVEQTGHTHFVKILCSKVPAAHRLQLRKHKATEVKDEPFVGCHSLSRISNHCVSSIKSNPYRTKKIKRGIFLGFLFTVNRGSGL